ncbi:MAG: hypothetical protein AAFX93_00645 [Verrucomicrobiota bacterium]
MKSRYYAIVAVATLGLVIGLSGSNRASGNTSDLEASFTPKEKELASYMAELQVLSHKLGLSIDADNEPLIKFYLHESKVKIEEIQNELPEYEGVPVALYMDRMAWPAYKSLDQALASKSGYNSKAVREAYRVLINSCNACHISSEHPYIRIKHNKSNPYLQDFAAQD